MKLALAPLAVAILLGISSEVFAVFPSKPVLRYDGKPLSARNFAETPRLLPDGTRFAPRPAETIVVILVEFPADTVDVDSTAVIDTCAAFAFDADHDTAYYNQKIFSEPAGSNSMDNYWDECSLGNMDISGPVLGPYTMPHCLKYYSWDSPGTIDDGWIDDAGNFDQTTCVGGVLSGTCRLIQDAVGAADGDIDYCDYDTDHDGFVDHVMVVHAGVGQEGSDLADYAIWSVFYPGLPYGPYDIDPATCPLGVSVNTGFIVPEYYTDIDKFPLGTFCHEFSHSIGNPDLYDVSPGLADVPDDNDHPVADWCLMDHGSWCGPTGLAESPSHLCAFNKIGSGWVNVLVAMPTPVAQAYTIYDLETSAQIPQGANCRALKITDPKGIGDYWLVENRDIRDPNADYDKYDSDWSDWTGHGAPDSLDCGLIITHILAPDLHALNMGNNGFAAYDYVNNPPACPQGSIPYEVWVEDPGYDDRANADYKEWWYPWEVKGGAAFADSSADDPHFRWDQAIHPNANCTRTASSIDATGQKASNVSVEATSDCSTQMTADIFMPGWVPITPVAVADPHLTDWPSFHHDITSGGWIFGGALPNIGSPFEHRLNVKWQATGPALQKASPIVTNTQAVDGSGQPVHGLAITASSNGYVYCYSAEDGRPVWSTNLGVQLRSTPAAVDTLRGRNGVSLVLNRVYVCASNGRLYYLNLLTGAVQGYWPAPAPQVLEAAPRVGWAENPTIPGNFVPLVFIGSTGGNMYALNATGPTLKWQYTAGSPIECPVALEYPQVTREQAPRVDAVYFGDAAGNVRCLRAYDGVPRWVRQVGGAVVGSLAICDSVTQSGIALQSDETVVASTGGGRVCAMDATTGDMLWSYSVGTTQPITSSPSVAVDRAYNWGMIWVESMDGIVYCLHLGTPRGPSRTIWIYPTGGGTASSPAVVLPYGMLPLGFDGAGDPIYPPGGASGDPARDGVVYLGCGGGGGGGRFIALDAANGNLIWDYAMPQAVSASAAVVPTRVYVSADRLYCFAPDEAAAVSDGGEAQVEPGLEFGPNPVRSSSIIQYAIGVESVVSLRVYDVRGRLVKSIYEGHRMPGRYKADWGGRNEDGLEVAAGIYFVRLDAGKLHISKKAVLVR
jgi:M6 family metalloprotease-like protein